MHIHNRTFENFRNLFFFLQEISKIVMGEMSLASSLFLGREEEWERNRGLTHLKLVTSLGQFHASL